jgi:hypothetical protein
MAKIRLVQKGWEKFSDYLGPIRFDNGVSIDDVSEMEAARIGASIRVDWVETGKSTSPAQKMIDSKNMSAADFNISVKGLPTAQEIADAKPVSSEEAPAPVVVKPAATVVYDYTLESLEAVADEEGIKGLRDIADLYDVKGVSISGMLRDLMAKKEAAQ